MIASLFCILLATHCDGPPTSKAKRALGRVIVKPRLVVRRGPGVQHAIVFSLDYSDSVELLEKAPTAFVLLGVPGRFQRIRHNGREGWAFDRFLGAAGEKAFYEVRDGIAERTPPGCQLFAPGEFPRRFRSGCAHVECMNTCGGMQLYDDGSVRRRDACDGMTGEGTWKPEGNLIRIRITTPGMHPGDICAYRDGTPACVEAVIKASRAKCGEESCPHSSEETILWNQKTWATEPCLY